MMIQTKFVQILASAIFIGLISLGFALASHSADLTGDGKVDAADLAVLKSQWRQAGTSTADLNHNGSVGEGDAGILFSSWGTLSTTPPPSGTVNADLGVANAHWDNFDRADSANLGTLASFTWRGWSDFAGDLRITGNRVISATPTTWSLTRLTGGPLSIGSDHWIDSDLKLAVSGDVGMIAVRKEDNIDRDFYALEWKAESGGPTLKIVKWVGGAETVLATTAFGKLGETHKFQLAARGSTLIAFADEVEKLRVTDTTYPATSLYRWVSIGLLGTAELDRVRWGQYAGDFATPPGATYRSGTRNAWEWPFDQNSVWNRPIGSGATYTAPVGKISSFMQSIPFSFNTTAYSTNVFLAKTTDPVGGLYSYSAVYGGYHEIGRTNIPPDAAPSIGTDGHIVIIEPNQEYMWETTAAARYLDGFRGDNVRRSRIRNSGWHSNFHGNTEMGHSGIVGLIRKGELTNGIFHTLNGVFWPYLLNNDYVWPANSVGGFGCAGCEPDGYDPNANVRHGTLLAIPPWVNLDSLGINHPKAKIIAQALQDYGLYVTDKGGNMVFRVEGSAAGDVPSGTEFTTMRNELLKATKFLQVVTNNRFETVGGGGTPRVPLPPSFAP